MMEDITVFQEVVNGFLTLVVFLLTIIFSPLLIFSYAGVKFVRQSWYTCLSIFNPDVEFIKTTTIRTLVDSHRNQGIFTVLLTIKGAINLEAVRRHLQEVTNSQDKGGQRLFPRLKESLVTRWGSYAWCKGNFDLDENLIVAPPITYRGRPISESNIQECVSDIVSKYLPTGISPWQVIIIPSVENQHYILLRVHHVLINEGLHIADLLPLKPPVYQHTEGDHIIKSPLLEAFKKPESILSLKEHLQEDFCNKWNEFVYNHDPLEKPELLKKTPGLCQYFALLLITAVSIIKNIKKSFVVVQDDILYRLKYILTTAAHESKRRHFVLSSFFNSIWITVQPKNIVKSFFRLCYYSCIFFLYVPVLFLYEFMALYSCVIFGYCKHSNTATGYIYRYTPLVYKAIREAFYYFKIITTTPKSVLLDILLEPGTVQTIPPCGRKVIAWSDEVKIQRLKKIACHTGTSETEILLACISATMYRYYKEAGFQIPKHVPITIRNVNSDYVFQKGSGVKSRNFVSGLLVLNLPILINTNIDSVLENVKVIRETFQRAMQNQPITYLLTILQTKYGILTNVLPPALVEILLKYLSRKYTISVTEITSQYSAMPHRTIWGEEVINTVYWRPPQANMSVSLCFNQNRDKISLGVMCDAQLLPLHPLLAKEFSDYVERLTQATGLH